MNNSHARLKDNDKVVIGIDVGTGSARAGVFDMSGNMLASAKRDITLFRDNANFAEQSSNEIWEAVCYCVKQAIASSTVKPQQVAGIGFDATCSLVVIGSDKHPITVSPSNDPERNIIVLDGSPCNRTS